MKVRSALQLWEQASSDVLMRVGAGLTLEQIANQLKERKYTFGHIPSKKYVIDRVIITSFDEAEELASGEEYSQMPETEARKILNERLELVSLNPTKGIIELVQEGEELSKNYDELSERTRRIKEDLGVEKVHLIYLGSIGHMNFLGNPRFPFTPKRIDKILEYSEVNQMKTRVHLIEKEKTGRIYLSYNGRMEALLLQSGYMAGTAKSFRDIRKFLY